MKATILNGSFLRSRKRAHGLALLALLALLTSHGAALYAADENDSSAIDAEIAAARAVHVIEAPTDTATVQKNAEAKAQGKSHDFKIKRLEFRKTKLVDVMHAISEISGINIVPTKTAGDTEITVYLRNVSVHEAVDTISRSNGLWYRQDKISSAYRVMTTKEYQSDMVVFRDDATEIFNLLHPNPVIVATVIQDIYGDRVLMTLGVEDDLDMYLGGSFGSGGFGSSGSSGSSGGFGMSSRSGLGSSRSSSRYGSRSSSSRYGSSRGFTSRSTGGRGARTNIVSERAITEELTPEQLSRLDAAVEQSTEADSVSSESLRGLSNKEQPIYVTVNREHNLIIVRTSDAAAMREIEALIKDLDRPTPQVLLEMKVLELSSGNSFRQTFSLSGTSGGGRETYGLGNFPVEGGTLVYNYIDSVISARLELLESKNQVNTLSSPVLLASNNKPAQVFVGEERVIVTGVDVAPATAVNGVVVSSVAVPVTEVRNIGNTLQILPKINADRTVTLVVQQDSSSVNVGGGTLPVLIGNSVQNFNIDTVNTSNIQGIVVAKDGLTVAIGGLISSRDSDVVQKVPFVSEIPVLGQLFQRKERIHSKSELVLLITPHIITNPSETENVTYDTMDGISEQDWE